MSVVEKNGDKNNIVDSTIRNVRFNICKIAIYNSPQITKKKKLIKKIIAPEAVLQKKNWINNSAWFSICCCFFFFLFILLFLKKIEKCSFNDDEWGIIIESHGYRNMILNFLSRARWLPFVWVGLSWCGYSVK